MAIAAAGLAVGFAKAGTAHPEAASSPQAANAITHVTVAASEFKFVFSKRSIAAPGTVIFTVVNKGKISHNFRIGTKTTPNLLPGKSATLTVKFTKKGRYAYLCTIPGHAAAGMKGVFAVATKAVPPPPSSTPSTTTTQPTTTTSTVPVGTAQTTVTVNMVEYAFQLSQTTIPSGQVTFVIKNSGNEEHNFNINGTERSSRREPPRPGRWRSRRGSTSTRATFRSTPREA